MIVRWSIPTGLLGSLLIFSKNFLSKMIVSMRRAIYTFLPFLSSKKHQKTVISAALHAAAVGSQRKRSYSLAVTPLIANGAETRI